MQIVKYENLFEIMQNYASWMRNNRRWLHEHAELMYKEIQTSEFIQQVLT